MNKKLSENNHKNQEIILALGLIIIGVAARFLPHLPNFVPITAIALFSGRYFSRKFALIIPIGIMLISDLILGFSLITFFVYAGFLVAVLIGYLWREQHSWRTIFGSSIASAVIFYLLTNFGVYITGNWYPHTFQGLIDCYLMAIPFFRLSLFGDLFYVTIFFGVYQSLTYYLENKRISLRAILIVK
jgi:hypothetical protein